MNKKIIFICDFDGTVTTEDVGMSIARRFLSPEWSNIIVDKQNGLISGVECFIQLLGLMNFNRKEYITFLEKEAEIDPSFPCFVDWCNRMNMPLIILSDGVDCYIEFILKKYNLNHLKYFSNKGYYKEGNPYLEFPFQNQNCRKCANCKKIHLEKYRKEGYQIIYAGDGKSDECISSMPDVLFVKGELLDYCEKHSIRCIPFEHFNQIIASLEKDVLKKLEA